VERRGLAAGSLFGLRPNPILFASSCRVRA
jgi:hypothetical protein